MKHEVTINVSKRKKEEILSCKVVPANSKCLEKILNGTGKVTVIIPGDTVQGINIKEIDDRGESNA